jgi:hypothetical protein
MNSERQPDRGLHRRLARLIQVRLDLGDDVIDALLGICLSRCGERRPWPRKRGQRD